MKKEATLKVRVDRKIAEEVFSFAEKHGINASEYQRVALIEQLRKDRKAAK